MFGVKSFLSTILCLVALAAASPVLDDKHAGKNTEVMIMKTEDIFEISNASGIAIQYVCM